MRRIRVAVFGTGEMGRGMISLILKKESLELVGVVARRRERRGMDVGKIIGVKNIGIKVVNDPEKVVEKGVDVFLHATCSRVRDAYPEIRKIVEAKVNVITIAEEMAYPWVAEPELSKELDRVAVENKVTILGTGINPGFVLDTLIITLTGVMERVDRIYAKRVNDLSPYGPTVMRTQGVGTTVEDFYKGVKSGEIVGHFGFSQSIHMIAQAIGWKVEEVLEERKPIVSKVERRTEHVVVKPGMVAGCHHRGIGIVDGEEKIILDHPQEILPQLEGVETGDYIRIEGEPPINFVNKPEIKGGAGTISIAVNMIPIVFHEKPGLITMKDTKIPRFLK